VYSLAKELSILRSFPQGGDFTSIDIDSSRERKQTFQLAASEKEMRENKVGGTWGTSLTN